MLEWSWNVEHTPAVAFTASADVWSTAIVTEIGTTLCGNGVRKDFNFNFTLIKEIF